MMKRTVKCLVLGTACCLLTACHWNVKETRQAQQPVDKKTASVAAFERIMLVGTPTIYYTQGDTTSVIVEAPRDLM
jgi:outer membrane biogenesis lipoprotein LolB